MELGGSCLWLKESLLWWGRHTDRSLMLQITLSPQSEGKSDARYAQQVFSWLGDPEPSTMECCGLHLEQNYSPQLI